VKREEKGDKMFTHKTKQWAIRLLVALVAFWFGWSLHGEANKEVIVSKPINRNVVVHTESENSETHGSGVIIGQNLILTCFHNLTTDNDIKVNGVNAIIIKVDPQHDLCLLGVPTPYVSPIEFAETVAQEDEVTVIGNPLGHKGMITHGQVVDIDNGVFYVDAHVFFGSSGGGCYNKGGQLIGIVTKLEGRQQWGFPYSVVIPNSVIFKFLTSSP
jgi:S1-C subfamily serine protease